MSLTREEELKKVLTEENIIRIMRRFGVEEFHDKGEYFLFPTICHNYEAATAGFNLAYYKESKLFRCFSECSETFDIFGLVKRRLMLEGLDSYRDNVFFLVLNHSNASLDSFEVSKDYDRIASKYKRKKIELELKVFNEGALDVFVFKPCVEWLNDGISIEAMKLYNIKYSISENKIIIPHYDINNNLIGIRGRPLDEEVVKKYGKYSPVKVENIMYNHPLGVNLYGLNVVKENIKRLGVAIIAEGEKSPLQAHAFLGENNVVCSSCGSAINKWQVLSLVKNCHVKEIVIAFDSEPDNKKITYYMKLFNMCKKYSNYCNFSFIYNRELLEYKDSPFDKGKEVFEELLKKRIKVI